MQNITAGTSLKVTQGAVKAQEKRTGFSGRETIGEHNGHGINGTGDDPAQAQVRDENHRIAGLREKVAA